MNYIFIDESSKVIEFPLAKMTIIKAVLDSSVEDQLPTSSKYLTTSELLIVKSNQLLQDI